MRTSAFQKNADLLGISSSVLCIIHCLLLPVLLLVGSFSDHLHRWALLNYAFILLAGVAVFFSTRQLPHSRLRVGLWLSWLSFSLAILLHAQYAEALYASVFSSLLLAFFHLASYRAKHA